MLRGENRERALSILEMSIQGQTFVEAGRKYNIHAVRARQVCQQVVHELIGQARQLGVRVPPHDYLSAAERLMYREFWAELIQRACSPEAVSALPTDGR